MDRRIDGAEGMAPQQRTITCDEKPAIAQQHTLSVSLVVRANAIPGQVRQLVMHHVVVVVEVQQTPEPARFIDDDAVAGRLAGRCS
jgi:hypothetical protein